jgi:2-oxoglutarate/2-oxoacid ferredoxin oxidoreductase subunit alpha
VPLHAAEISDILQRSRRIVVVENNQSGQFARHLRAETGIAAHGHIRKYDGEPFEPKHIVAAVREILEKTRDREAHIVEVLSTEPGWQTIHPTGTSSDWAGRRAAAVANQR